MTFFWGGGGGKGKRESGEGGFDGVSAWVASLAHGLGWIWRRRKWMSESVSE